MNKNFQIIRRSTHLLVQPSADSTLGAALLVQKVDKGLLGALAGVVPRLAAALREELDRGERLDAILERKGTVSFSIGINIGHDALCSQSVQALHGVEAELYVGLREEVLGNFK